MSKKLKDKNFRGGESIIGNELILTSPENWCPADACSFNCSIRNRALALPVAMEGS